MWGLCFWADPLEYPASQPPGSDMARQYSSLSRSKGGTVQAIGRYSGIRCVSTKSYLWPILVCPKTKS